MKIQRIILASILASLAACSGDGQPSEREMADAIRSKSLFDVREHLPDEKSVDIAIEDLKASDCIENAGQWRCRVEADFIVRHPERGEMKDKMRGNVTFRKVEGKWTADLN